MTKQNIKIEVTKLNVELPLTQLVKELETLIALHGATAEAKLESNGFDEWSVYIFVSELETDEEYTQRTKAEAAKRARAKAQDLSTLARLKAEYPDAV